MTARLPITTVTGDVSAETFKFCQCHEHLLIAPGRSGEIDPALCFSDISKSSAEVRRYRDAGGSALVDAQPVGCGRMAAGLLQISREAEILLVASTGFHKMLFYPENHWIFSATPTYLTNLFLHELREGMYVDADYSLPTEWIPARAGIIKTALDSCNLTPLYEKLFYAAATASRLTGAPVMIHVEKGSAPLELLNFYVKMGLSPSRLIFCHLDRACSDISVHTKLCRAGCYLEYDTIGRFKYHSDEEEVLLFQILKKEGLLSHLLFSLDTTRLRLKTYGGQDAVGLDYILHTFLPLLIASGFSPEEIREISVLNPRAALAKQPEHIQ